MKALHAELDVGLRGGVIVPGFCPRETPASDGETAKNVKNDAWMRTDGDGLLGWPFRNMLIGTSMAKQFRSLIVRWMRVNRGDGDEIAWEYLSSRSMVGLEVAPVTPESSPAEQWGLASPALGVTYEEYCAQLERPLMTGALSVMEEPDEPPADEKDEMMRFFFGGGK